MDKKGCSREWTKRETDRECWTVGEHGRGEEARMMDWGRGTGGMN